MKIIKTIEAKLTTEEVIYAVAEYITKERGYELPARFSLDCPELTGEGTPEDLIFLVHENDDEVPF